jgi:UPF0271 protein
LQADSVCVHGDSPEAAAMARLVRERLQAEGVTVAAFGPAIATAVAPAPAPI